MPQIVSPTLGMHITAELEKRGMNVTQFRKELSNRYGNEVAIPGYNHFLKVCKGETFPGRNFLPWICKFLALDFREADQWVKIDKAKQNGTADAFQKAFQSKKDPQRLAFDTYWKMMNPHSRADILALAKMKAEQDLRR